MRLRSTLGLGQVVEQPQIAIRLVQSKQLSRIARWFRANAQAPAYLKLVVADQAMVYKVSVVTPITQLHLMRAQGCLPVQVSLAQLLTIVDQVKSVQAQYVLLRLLQLRNQWQLQQPVLKIPKPQ